MYKFVKIEPGDGLATLWLNRPPLNVFNIAMMEEVISALKEVQANQDMRLLVIRGMGRCFSAGMDVGDHLPDRVKKMFAGMHEMHELLIGLGIPTICVIHGSAMGGGLEVAAAADFVYAIAGCKLGQPEIRLGVFPPFAVAHFVQLIGFRNALDYILTGRMISPEEAVATGLINEVWKTDDAESRLEQICSTLLKMSKTALSFTKKALYQSHLMDRMKAAEQIYLNELMKTHDAVEGLNAFLEKREPNWSHK